MSTTMTWVNDIRVEDIPEDMKELAEKYHDELVEHVAEQDDELLEKYLGGEELTIDEIKTCIRKATIANKMVPVCLRYFLPQQGCSAAA